MGYLWFLTFIFVCYILVPLLESWKPSSGRFCLVLVGMRIAEIASMLLFGAAVRTAERVGRTAALRGHGRALPCGS